ncbi:protein of unknown function [Rhodovastum atsumiense]|nr:protein of unknown function [Rhodovastum atsumiense]
MPVIEYSQAPREGAAYLLWRNRGFRSHERFRSSSAACQRPLSFRFYFGHAPWHARLPERFSCRFPPPHELRAPLSGR